VLVVQLGQYLSLLQCSQVSRSVGNHQPIVKGGPEVTSPHFVFVPLCFRGLHRVVPDIPRCLISNVYKGLNKMAILTFSDTFRILLTYLVLRAKTAGRRGEHSGWRCPSLSPDGAYRFAALRGSVASGHPVAPCGARGGGGKAQRKAVGHTPTH
jgi:hypothetical protein